MRVVLCLLLIGCGSKAAPTSTTPQSTEAAKPAAEERSKVGVALHVTPGTASVTIDDLVVGQASELDPVFSLAPGLHTLVITQDGFKPYRMEFSVTDKAESFTITLEPKR